MTLKELRISAGKSLAEVAKKLNVCERTIRHYEKGDRRLNIEQLIPLALLYGATLDEIVEAAISVQ